MWHRTGYYRDTFTSCRLQPARAGPALGQL